VSTDAGTAVVELSLSGSREQIRAETVLRAISAVIETVGLDRSDGE
jgi:hypothetical protein